MPPDCNPFIFNEKKHMERKTEKTPIGTGDLQNINNILTRLKKININVKYNGYTVGNYIAILEVTAQRGNYITTWENEYLQKIKADLPFFEKLAAQNTAPKVVKRHK